MKLFNTMFLIFVTALSFAQSETVVPENTLVPLELTLEIREGKVKPGEAARFVVADDVKINGTVVVSKNSPVHATVSIPKKKEMRVDVFDVTAVDGTVIKLNDCWIFTTAAQNLNGKESLIVKGTKKNCYTAVKTTIKGTNKQF